MSAERGLKRASAVGWTLLAALMLLRAPVWAILSQHREQTALFYVAAVLLPLAGHLVTVWVVNGFARRD